MYMCVCEYNVYICSYIDIYAEDDVVPKDFNAKRILFNLQVEGCMYVCVYVQDVDMHKMPSC